MRSVKYPERQRLIEPASPVFVDNWTSSLPGKFMEIRYWEATHKVRYQSKPTGKEVDLKERLRNDPRKLEIATRIRKETTLPIHWIARRLQLGTPKSARSMIHEKLRSNEVEGKKPLSCKQLELQPIV
jgi:hypothetical protein